MCVKFNSVLKQLLMLFEKQLRISNKKRHFTNISVNEKVTLFNQIIKTIVAASQGGFIASHLKEIEVRKISQFLKIDTFLDFIY